MSEIIRHDINEEWAHSGVIEAGDFVFVGYCVGNIGQSVEAQVNGALDHLCERLELVGLTLESVVQIDALFREIWNIPIMEKVFKERFNGKYPVRKSIQTNFAHIGGAEGLHFQLDATAYRGKLTQLEKIKKVIAKAITFFIYHFFMQQHQTESI